MEKEDEKMGEVKIESIKKKKGWDKKTEDETVFLLLFKGGWLSKWYFPNSSHKDSYCVLPQKSKGIGYYPFSYITCFMLAAEREYFYEVVIHLPGRWMNLTKVIELAES